MAKLTNDLQLVRAVGLAQFVDAAMDLIRFMAAIIGFIHIIIESMLLGTWGTEQRNISDCLLPFPSQPLLVQSLHFVLPLTCTTSSSMPSSSSRGPT